MSAFKFLFTILFLMGLAVFAFIYYAASVIVIKPLAFVLNVLSRIKRPF